jgi:hypothetical protein
MEERKGYFRAIHDVIQRFFINNTAVQLFIEDAGYTVGDYLEEYPDDAFMFTIRVTSLID